MWVFQFYFTHFEESFFFVCVYRMSISLYRIVYAGKCMTQILWILSVI